MCSFYAQRAILEYYYTTPTNFQNHALSLEGPGFPTKDSDCTAIIESMALD